MKRILAILTIAATMFTAKAQYALITPAGYGYNVMMDQTEYFWSPDGTPSFIMSIYENNWQNGHWHYTLAATKANGHSAYTFYDSRDPNHPLYYDHCFVIVQSLNATLTLNNAVAHNEFPQWWGSIDHWDWTPYGWESFPLVPMYPNTWAMYVVHYRAPSNDLSYQLVTFGNGTAPSSISESIESAYGQ